MKTQTADVMSQNMVLMPPMKTRRGTTQVTNKQTLAEGGSEGFTANHRGPPPQRERVSCAASAKGRGDKTLKDRSTRAPHARSPWERRAQSRGHTKRRETRNNSVEKKGHWKKWVREKTQKHKTDDAERSLVTATKLLQTPSKMAEERGEKLHWSLKL